MLNNLNDRYYSGITCISRQIACNFIALKKSLMRALIRGIAFLFFLFAALAGFSQENKNKFGYVDVAAVMQNLPAYKDAQKKLQGYVSQLQQQLAAMRKEDSIKVMAYQNDEPTLVSPFKEIRQQEITDLEGRIEQLQGSSEEQINQKQVELLKPLEETIQSAIKSVADENKYTYVFNSSMGSALLYSPPGDDLSELVKTKLNAK